MKTRSITPKLVSIVAGATMVCSLSVAILTVHALERRRIETKADEVLFISSPKLLKRMSLGYHGLLADLYWTRAVQYFGRKHNADERGYTLLGPILKITSQLDPHLLPTYQYGSIFLAQRPPDGAGDPQGAVDLIKFGIEQNPEAWRLYHTLGFVYAIELKDYASAARAFAQGSKVPGALAWMAVMAANMAQHGGEIETARYMWLSVYQTSQDKSIRENAYNHLRSLEAKQDIQQLEKMVMDFRNKTGRNPAGWDELVETGALLRVPHDPTGRAYKLMRDGEVGVQNPKDLPYVDAEKFDPLHPVQPAH